MLCTHPNNDAAYENHPRYQELTGWLPHTWEERQTKLRTTRDVERSHLLDELYSGRLWAIGFVTEPDGFDRPTRVPREHFFFDFDRDPQDQPQIDWSKGELISPDMSYFDIHVVRPPEQDSANYDETGDQPLRTDEQKAPPSKSKRGRPSTGNEIRTKVIEMWNDPEFQKMSPRITQAREVRARLLGEKTRDQDDYIGYSTSSIKRIIGKVASQRSE